MPIHAHTNQTDLNALPKSNYSASAAPTANNDSGSGYSIGSKWYDATNDKAYVCLDASSGAAIWREYSCEYAQADFVFPGAFMADRSAGDDLVEIVIRHIFKWESPKNAKLISLKAVVAMDDSGGTQPQINLEIAGTEALSSALTLGETEASGTVNTSANNVATGNRVEITVVNPGTNSDAEDLTVRTLWEIVS